MARVLTFQTTLPRRVEASIPTEDHDSLGRLVNDLQVLLLQRPIAFKFIVCLAHQFRATLQQRQVK